MDPMAEFAAFRGQVNDQAATARTTPKVSSAILSAPILQQQRVSSSLALDGVGDSPGDENRTD
jgi:hypothetical protein